MTTADTRRRALRALIATRFGGVQSRFGSAVGRQSDYVSRLVTGKKHLGERLARDIERILGLDPGHLDREPIELDPVPEVGKSLHFGMSIPLVSWADLVRPDHTAIKKMGSASVQYLPRPDGVSDSTYALVVRGSAMEPEFRDGWLIYVDPQAPARHNDFVIARLRNHLQPVLRQLMLEGDITYLRALNPQHPGSLVELGGGEILGRVVYQARKY
jgi:hypothetical protein